MNKDFERILAEHCAPVLFGKKPAALLAENLLPNDCAWEALLSRGLRLVRLTRRESASPTLIYQPDLLSDALSQPKTQCALKQLGYPSAKAYPEMLRYLRRRFYESEAFPHEVGFFLGYPPEDVLGFMECPGNCKLCGLWKVYGDVDAAKSLFIEYARCRQALLRHIESGGSIFACELPALAG